MSGIKLPPIASLPKLSTAERAAVLDALFEPCVALHTLSVDFLHTQTFESYNDLIASIGVQLTDLSESVSTSDTEWLDKILGAHPRLGEKKVESAQSKAEQAQLNTGNEEETTKLRQLNVEYEETFPGLRYVYDAPRVGLDTGFRG
jgi:2-oxo-4-hydroxy-4-carboxy--5-ureidoimidazoline (OHCU) decarboxylase